MPSPARTLLLFLGCFGFFAFFAHGYLENTDAMVSMQGARAWWLRGNPGLVTKAQAESLPEGTPSWAVEYFVADQIAGDPARLGRTGVDDLRFVWFPIGHQALFVPFVVVGDWLADRFPAVQERSDALRGELLGAQFWPQFLASFLSPLAAAGSVIMLLGLARTLGASARESLWIVLVATLCTQFWPGATETMSNAPGTFFLFATTHLVARYAIANAGPKTLFSAGLVAGVGVVVRYPQATTVALLGLWALHAAWRRGAWKDILWFVGGGVPALVVLLALNHWRFADPFETGYSDSAGFGLINSGVGLVAILFAPGKGVMWFTPLLWLVLPLSVTRPARCAATWFALGSFGVTLALYSSVVYWAAGQCWGIRYMTAPIVLLTVVVFARTRPWQNWRRTSVSLAAVGFVFSLGGVITPYPGQQALALAAGRTVYGDYIGVDDNVNFDVAMSPLHSHWTYAWLSATGRLDSGSSADTTEPLFGVEVESPPPLMQTERGFHHFWWRWLGAVIPGFPGLWVAIGWVAVTSAALWVGLRRAVEPVPPGSGG